MEQKDLKKFKTVQMKLNKKMRNVWFVVDQYESDSKDYIGVMSYEIGEEIDSSELYCDLSYNDINDDFMELEEFYIIREGEFAKEILTILCQMGVAVRTVENIYLLDKTYINEHASVVEYVIFEDALTEYFDGKKEVKIDKDTEDSIDEIISFLDGHGLSGELFLDNDNVIALLLHDDIPSSIPIENCEFIKFFDKKIKLFCNDSVNIFKGNTKILELFSDVASDVCEYNTIKKIFKSIKLKS